MLEAAWAVLAESGWHGFTMEGVAARAGTGKAPLYQRWPNRTALVRATMFHHGGQVVATTDHGSVRADLASCLHSVAESLAGPMGEALRGLVATASEFPLAAPDQIPIDAVRVILERARDRRHPDADGLLISGDPAQLSIRLLNLGPRMVAHDFLTDGRPTTPDRIEEILDLVWLPLLVQQLGNRVHAQTP